MGTIFNSQKQKTPFLSHTKYIGEGKAKNDLQQRQKKVDYGINARNIKPSIVYHSQPENYSRCLEESRNQ